MKNCLGQNKGAYTSCPNLLTREGLNYMRGVFLVGFHSVDLVGAASCFCLFPLEAAVVDWSRALSLRDVVSSKVSSEVALLDDHRWDFWLLVLGKGVKKHFDLELNVEAASASLG